MATEHASSALAKNVARRLESARHQMTLEALAEAAAGKTDSHAEVVRWAARLAKRRISQRNGPGQGQQQG